jgi:predicted  nucleic acid-binding Zn-ribbon protein
LVKSFVSQSRSAKAQEQFQDDLKAVRDMLMQSYGNRGKVSTPISTSEDTFLEDDSVNEAFNQFKNKVKETVQSIPNINSNNLTLKIPALQSRIKVLQDAIKSAEESIKVGTEIDDLYNMFIENAKEEIKNLKETITSLTEELTKQENLPKGQIIHRSEEYTQMFSAFETDINWITDPSADIISNTSIKVVDFEGGDNYIETKGNDGLTSIQTGITKGLNKGKAVQVIYKGQVIGSLLDPNRFVLSSTKHR